MSGQELAVVLVASLVGAFLKAVTGMGYPLIAVPVISLVLGVEDAVVIVAAPNLAANALLCWNARDNRHEARDLSRLVGFGLIGAVGGTFALVNVAEDPLLIILTITIALFVGNYVVRPDIEISASSSRRWSPAVGLAAGVMQGAVGVSGPVVAAWVHGYRLSKQAYVFTVTMIFGATGAVQFTLLALSGTVTADRAMASGLAFVPVLAMLPIGTRLRSRLGGVAFERIVLAVLVGSGAALVYRVVS